MKKVIALFLAILTLGTSASAESLSTWSKREYTKLSSGAFLNVDFLSGKLTDNITRKEFCKILIKLYELNNDIYVTKEDNIYSDCDDEAVIKAHKAGIVNGKTENTFDPDGLVTRQEMAVMISRLLKSLPIRYIQNENQVVSFKNRFTDYNNVASWAISDFATVCYYDIISGTDGKCSPLSYATKEQSLCMMCRVYENFQEAVDYYQLPLVNLTQNNDNTINISWKFPNDVKYYNIVIKNKYSANVIKNVTRDQKNIENYPVNYSGNNEYTVYVNAVLESGAELLSLPVSVTAPKEATTPKLVITKTEKEEEAVKPAETVQKTQEQPKVEETKPVENTKSIETTSEKVNQIQETHNSQKATTEKELRVFPSGYYFETADEASKNMVEVCIPCWSLQTDGSKVSTKKYLVVNKALADDVVSIFTEIYNDSSKFPIKDVGGYNWRNTAYGKISQHSYGTCIDINANENYYVTPDGKAVVGSYWKPGVDPYSIAEDSIVVKTFAKYGFLWGGNCWGEKYNRDYMHFTYLGK